MSFQSTKVFLKVVLLLSSCLVKAQTFPGVGGLPFPPSGTIGITQSTNNVTGVGIIGGCTTIENVTIDLNHTWDGDIAFFLIAPNGVFIELSSGNGGPGDNFWNTVFTDSAPLNIIDGSPPYTGSFQPEGRQNSTLTNPYPNAAPPGTFTFANTFNGVNANGQWILYLNDYVVADIGFLNSWSITFSNGGTSFTVDLGSDFAVCSGSDITLNATNTAPNPTNYAWSNGGNTPSISVMNITSTTTYTVTVSDVSGCTSTDQILVTVNPSPNGNPITYVQCETSTGIATFNLSSIISGIGSGQPVTFFTDIGLTNPITNLTTYMSSNAIIYAVVTQGSCSSAPVPITLEVSPNNASAFGLNILQDAICGPGLIQIDLTLPSSGVYTYNYQLNCVDGNQSSTLTTSANPIFFSISGDCTFLLTSVTATSSGCTTTFAPPLTDNVIVDDIPSIAVSNMEICPGESIDLSNFVTSSNGSVLTFHSASPPDVNNQLSSSIVMPNTTTTYYGLATLNDCQFQTALIVTVLPGGIPFNNSLQFCENNGAVNLTPYVIPSSLSGTWSGQGVTGSTFDPIGLSGTVVLEFDPDNQCYNNGVIIVNITPNQALNLGTTTICSSDPPFNLDLIVDPQVPNGIWSGPGVNSSIFDPTNLSGSITLTFTPTDNCISPSNTTVTINSGPMPIIQSNISVCQGAVVDLNDFVTLSSGNTSQFYFTLPAIPINEITNSVITIANNAQYYVKVSDLNGCFNIASLVINTVPGGIPQLGTALLCQNQNTYDLNILNDPNAGAGIWSGPNVSSNILDLSGQNGIINVVFTPINTCFDITDTNLEILIPEDIVLNSDQICSLSGNYNLLNLVDPSYPNGAWNGPGVSSNIFNPASQTGIITLTFDPIDFCVNSSTTTIEVIPSTVPSLTPTTICETTSVVNLNNLVDPLYTSGVWSGTGVNGNILETIGLSGSIPITFTSDEICIFPATTVVTIVSQATPQLGTISICENELPIDLSTFIDPNYPVGIWSGPGVTNGYFDPSDLTGMVTLNFISNSACTAPASTSASVLGSPKVSGLNIACDQSTLTYVVSFNIEEGDPNTYTINGSPAGNNFISNPIPSNGSYRFVVTDINKCEQVFLVGNKNCDCVTYSGSMNSANTPIKVCVNGSATAIFNNDNILDNNDILRFVLHDSPNSGLGTIYAINFNPTFLFPSNGSLGTTYYISAIAGDSLLTREFNLSDPCLSVSTGVPVIFYEPMVSMNPVNEVCAASCLETDIIFEGTGPFNCMIQIKNGRNIIKSETISSIGKVFKYKFCPKDVGINSGNLELIISEFFDNACKGRILNNNLSFKINPERNSNISQSICKGESISINGNLYGENKLIGTEVIFSNTQGQCDSNININLKLLQPSIKSINNTICSSQSILVNGTTYNINNPSGTEVIIKGNILGCDSIINVSLKFTNEIVNNLTKKLCKGEFIDVNNKRYDESKPTGTEIIRSQESTKCDSVINISLTFEKESINQLSQTLCFNDSIIINGKKYHRNKNSGQEIIKNGAATGCDSTIIINLNFYSEAIANISDTLCITDSINILGNIFSFKKQNGQFNIQNGNINGCDSTVNVQLYFYPQKLDTLTRMIKVDETIIINGVLFDKDNLTNLTTDVLPDENGCQREIFVIVSIEQEFITATLETKAETCPNKNDGNIYIDQIQGCKNYTITLGSDTIKNPVLPVSFNNLRPGIYQLKIIGDNNCLYNKTIEILPSASQPIQLSNLEFKVNIGESKSLNIGYNPIPNSIKWTPPTFLTCDDCLYPDLKSPLNDITYLLTLTNIDGCEFNNNVKVIINSDINNVTFPNIFSPNGDGNNDIWSVTLSPFQRIKSFNVYDRWGSNVYSFIPTPNENTVSWDGKLNGLQVIPGVYVFTLETLSQKSVTNISYGNITLIR